MTFVVDASITLAWCFEDEASGDAEAALERLLAEGAIAPAHWPLEIANALWSAERRGRLAASDLPTLRSMLITLPVEILPVELSTALSTIDTAQAHGLSAYDATYLHLAEVRGLGLATIDARLRAACASAGVPVIP